MIELPHTGGRVLAVDQVPQLEVRAVTKKFGETVAVDQVSFRLFEGQFLSLLGPSGCGKTTTLRMIAGFLTPDEGAILYRGTDITYEPPYRRDLGLVFQNYALFPHMSVAQNIAFGLRMRKAGKNIIQDRVQWALEVVRLSGFGDRRPHELSGGQQQRVAVARVLAVGAAVLLLDEPFSNLDAKLRRDMQVELRELQQKLGIATLHVTHDQQEAMSMSDVLVILNHGRIEQTGTPVEIYQQPNSQFVAEFMGQCNKFPGRVAGQSQLGGIGLTVQFDIKAGGHLHVLRDERTSVPDSAVALVRPEHIIVGARGAFGNTVNVLPGTVQRSVYLGSVIMLNVRLANAMEILVECHSSPQSVQRYEPGTDVDLLIAPSNIRMLILD
jgi:ABC-type Fe3+/spermidine/putrescine transport system ATPase subunit